MKTTKKNMTTRNSFKTLALALGLLVTTAVGSSIAFGQNNAVADDSGNVLVGVWEASHVPAENDCATGSPLPDTPLINVLNTFNAGGTGWIEDTAPFDGPYRSTGATIWKRTSGRNYTYVNWHYAFDPDKTFLWTIKQTSNLTLSKDSNSFDENGTFQVIIPDGTVVYSGCFTATSHRLGF